MHNRTRVTLLAILFWSTALIGAGIAQTTRYVSTTGSDTGNCTGTPCRTIQRAVDQSAPGDEVRVAGGTYADLRRWTTAPVVAGYQYGIPSQVLSIQKAITVRGGYADGDWSASDPVSRPTVLDAGYAHTVVTVTGSFQAGETIVGGSSGARAAVSGIDGPRFKLAPTSGTLVAGEVVTGETSGATGQIGNAYTIVPLSGALEVGETVTGSVSGAAAQVADVVGNRLALRVTSGVFRAAETLTGGTSGATATLADIRLTVSGRVVLVSSVSGVMLEGLRLTGGNASRSANSIPMHISSQTGTGGGIAIEDATATLDRLTIDHNTASSASGPPEHMGFGGGIFANRASVVIRRSTITANNANPRWWGYGHGMAFYNSQIILEDTTIADNVGGGVQGWQGYGIGEGTAAYLWRTTGTLRGNTIRGNGQLVVEAGRAIMFGGPGPLRLIGNRIENNEGRAFSCSGANDYDTRVTLSGNLFLDNPGGAVELLRGARATLTNNVFQRNGGPGVSGSAFLVGSSGSAAKTFRHNTVAGNLGTDAVHISRNVTGTLEFANTLFAGNTTALGVESGEVTLDHTLWDGNGVDVAGTVTETFPVTGSAAFAADGYHLTAASAAVDAGAPAGEGTDVDRDIRFRGRAPDIGADESPYALVVQGGAVAFEAVATPPKWLPSGCAGQSPCVDQTYFLRFANGAQSGIDIPSFAVEDRFPTGLSLLSSLHFPPMTGAQAGQTFTWQSASPLNPGEWGWFVLRGQSSTLTPGTVIRNDAEFRPSGQSPHTASAETSVPLLPPLLASPVSGEMCAGEVEVTGLAQPNLAVRIFENGTTLVGTATANASGRFSYTYTSSRVGIQAATDLSAVAVGAGGALSKSSAVVTLTKPTAIFCSQRSSLNGVRFRNPEGMASMMSWAVGGTPGRTVSLNLYACACEESGQPPTDVQVKVNSATITDPDGPEGRLWEFSVPLPNRTVVVSVLSKCSEMQTEWTEGPTGRVLIDPDGYVFDVTKGFDAAHPTVNALAGARVTAYAHEPALGGWVVWPADLYNNQVNPQTTGTDGYFAFFTPPGLYYLQVEDLGGFQPWRSQVVEVVSEIVHVNVPLTPVGPDGSPRVTVTPDGITPATLTLPVGGTVEWFSTLSPGSPAGEVMSDTENPVLRVASAQKDGSPIPALASVLGFDSGMLAPGHVYRRQFTQAGTYTFSDGAGHTGSVVVEAAPAPTVATVQPISGSVLGGTPVTITGTHFVAGATVTIGGVAATGITVVDSSTITLTTGAHAAGAADLVVTNPDAQAATAVGAFTFVPPAAPSVTAVSPESGPTSGGTAVVISGTGFFGTPTVTIGGVAAAVTSVSATQISATTGQHDAGAVDVVVTNPDTQAGTLSGGFTYLVVTSLKYYLAEGTTAWTFETTLALLNPGPDPAPVTVSFLKEDGTTAQATRVVPAGTRDTLRVADVPGMEDVAFATVVDSTAGVPLVVERMLTWDDGHAAHGGTATAALSPAWYFAEGAQGAFDCYFLIANPGDVAADVTVTYLPESGAPIVQTIGVGPRTRATLWAGSEVDLWFRSFSTTITATQPVVAERAMYFGATRHWDGGTVAMGVTSPATAWQFAEGASGPVFDLFLLLGNPNATAATVTVTYLLADGAAIARTYTLAGSTRRTVWVNGEALGLARTTGIAMQVTSDQPVLAERAMYWPAPYPSWRDGHASAGATATGTAWALAEGRVGGEDHCETYLLLSNPGNTASQVRITYMRAAGRTAVQETVTVAPTSRLTVPVGGTPGLSDETFGILVEVLSGSEIVAERSMYWDAGGLWWAAGTTVVGTRLR